MLIVVGGPAKPLRLLVVGLEVSFTASSDHAATDPVTDEPLVSSYELRVYVAFTGELVGTEDVGKPAPNGSNVITVTNSALLAGLSPGSYVLNVVTLGPHSDVSPDQEAVSYAADFTV